MYYHIPSLIPLQHAYLPLLNVLYWHLLQFFICFWFLTCWSMASTLSVLEACFAFITLVFWNVSSQGLI